MAENINSVGEFNSTEATTAENKNVEKVTATEKQNTSTKSRLIDDIIVTTAGSVAALGRATDSKKIADDVKSILRTVAEINTTSEYDIGLRVNGELYRYDEYQMTTRLSDLVVAARVEVHETVTSYDFSDKNAWKATVGRVLTPSELIVAIKATSAKLRKNPNLNSCNRNNVLLLSEAAKYAVNGRKVPSRQQKSLYFLTIKCDDEACDKITEWCQTTAMTLFD